MIEKSGIIKNFQKNFILDETKLRKINDIIKQHSAKLAVKTYIKYRVILHDNTYYDTRNIEDVLQNDNIKDNPIARLLLMLIKEKDKEEDIITSIDYALESITTANISFSITSEDKDWCSLFAQDLESQISRTLTQYIPSFFFGIECDLLASIILTGIVLSIGVYYFTGNQHILTAVDIAKMSIDERTQKILLLLNSAVIPRWIVPVLFIGLAGWFFFLLFRPISHLFGLLDRSFFEWGDMKEISKKYQRRLRYIILGALGGLFISIVGGIAVHYLFSK